MFNCSCRNFTHLLKPDAQAKKQHLKDATRLVPTLPVSMCSSLTERVHVTLWSHGNAVPVHCSYHGVSSSLQQQTDQFKISCKARQAFLLLLKSSICSPKPQIPAEELLQWEEKKSPYQQLLPAVKEFQSNFPLHALRNLLLLLQHPAIARKKIHHLEQLGVSQPSEFMNSDKWESNAFCYLQTRYNGDTWHANSAHYFTEANSFLFSLILCWQTPEAPVSNFRAKKV